MTFLLAMAHALPDPVVGVDGAGCIRAWNAAAARAFGVGEEDAYGKSAVDLLGHDVHAPRGALQRLRGRAGVVEAYVDVVAIAGSGRQPHEIVAMVVVRPAAPPGAPMLAAGEDLPPRLRQTLEALCEGLSEKEIAARLALSPHTVHGYVKAVYRRFGVQSRAALVARVVLHRTRR